MSSVRLCLFLSVLCWSYCTCFPVGLQASLAAEAATPNSKDTGEKETLTVEDLPDDGSMDEKFEQLHANDQSGMYVLIFLLVNCQ